ncbi:hypothetical protein ACEQ8H_005340 [Pleosporales sp. CAS-2024a]
MASDAQNNPFIRQLTSSDKQVRDQALSSLRTYLSSQSQISELDLLKLWKGLFCCTSTPHFAPRANAKTAANALPPGLWMQDKPANQQYLSRSLASLVPSLRDAVVIPFLRAFWLTMAREWSHIEALRLDKYLYLIRRYMAASFDYLARKKWDARVLEAFNEVMAETPLHPKDMKIPNGLRYHVLDVWVDELEKVRGGWEKSDEVLEVLVKPIEALGNDGVLRVLRDAARECLADERLMAWRGMEVQQGEPSAEESDEEMEWGGFAD